MKEEGGGRVQTGTRKGPIHHQLALRLGAPLQTATAPLRSPSRHADALLRNNRLPTEAELLYPITTMPISRHHATASRQYPYSEHFITLRRTEKNTKTQRKRGGEREREEEKGGEKHQNLERRRRKRRTFSERLFLEKAKWTWYSHTLAPAWIPGRSSVGL